MVGRADIDLADDAGAVPLPADVDHRRYEQNARERHTVEAAARVHGRQAVGDEEDNQRADRRLGDRALAAAERDAAEHGRGQHDHLEADPDVAADRAEAGGEEERANRSQGAAGDVAERDRAPDRDAGIVGRSARAADRGDVPSRPQTGQENVPEDRDRQIDDRDARNTEHITPADEVPGRKVGERRGDLVRIALDQEVEGRAVDDQRDQGRDKGAQPQVTDQEAVDRAEQRAEGDRCGGDRDDRPGQYVERVERAEVGQREHRSDREIDPANDYDQRFTERDEADLARLTRGVRQARRGQEVVDHAAQCEADDQKDDDRYCGLGPTLGQDFAEQMIRPVAISPAGQGFAHRWPIAWRNKGADIRGQPPRTPRVYDGYFFRSLSFQHAVSAFSLVIGMSVV